jgi:glycosyltransferase involved in cell wall biosynthesis
VDAVYAIELSVVIPCLNEAETLGTCLTKAFAAMAQARVSGEVIVADNGSEDGSREIARAAGAIVVDVEERGYGAALMGGIARARGRFILMADADDSYDLAEIPKFLGPLREGAELVQGCRLSAGGGRVRPGAMPPLHRWLGNPFFSMLARRWFGAPIHDVYCGMRGFTRELYTRLHQRCTGMEFATEMIIKASLYGARIAEVPITLHPDGRVARRPHLKTFRDGWRTLRFFLMSSPRWLFFWPGMALAAAGVVAYALALSGHPVGGVRFDAHTLLFGSLFLILGFQSALFAVVTKVFAINERLLPPDPRVSRLLSALNMERGLLLGVGALLAGGGLLVLSWFEWKAAGFGAMDYPRTLRWVIPGVTLAALGFQTILFGAFISILGMRRA